MKKWIEAVIKKEKKSPGEINYIFCDDDSLLALNKKYLNHDTFTDILTFDYSGEAPIKNKIIADIYISIPRVKSNAKKFNTPFEKELSRVMIHGILHLCGYKDKTRKDKTLMRMKEEECLKEGLRMFIYL